MATYSIRMGDHYFYAGARKLGPVQQPSRLEQQRIMRSRIVENVTQIIVKDNSEHCVLENQTQTSRFVQFNESLHIGYQHSFSHFKLDYAVNYFILLVCGNHRCVGLLKKAAANSETSALWYLNSHGHPQRFLILCFI